MGQAGDWRWMPVWMFLPWRLISQRVCVRVEEAIVVESAGELTLKGLSKPLLAFSVMGAKSGTNP